MKSIAARAPTFFGYIISVLVSVTYFIPITIQPGGEGGGGQYCRPSPQVLAMINLKWHSVAIGYLLSPFYAWIFSWALNGLYLILGTIIKKYIDPSTPQSHLVSTILVWDTLYLLFTWLYWPAPLDILRLHPPLLASSSAIAISKICKKNRCVQQATLISLLSVLVLLNNLVWNFSKYLY